MALGCPNLLADMKVVLGSDYLETVAGTSFAGVPFMGVPLDPATATGPTDTIVQRQQDATVPTSGTASPINIQLTELQLETVGPTNAFGPLDNYFVTLQSNRSAGEGGPVNPSTGQMTISGNATDTGGTFSSFFDVFFDIREGSLTGSIVFSGDVQLSNGGASWGTTPTFPPGTAPVLIPGLVGDQTANLHTNLNTVPDGVDFFPGEISEDASGAAHHVVDPADVPEPGSIFLLLTVAGMTACLSRLRRT